MHTTQTERHFIFVLLVIVLLITLAILYPFLTVIVLSGAFAVVLTPTYKWINKKVVKDIPWLASTLTILMFLIVLCVPLVIVGNAVFKQTQNAYQSIVNNGGADRFINSLDSSINSVLPEGFTFDTSTKITNFIVSLSSNFASIFTSTFNSIVMFIIMIFALFYLLKDGEEWKKGLVSILPLSNENAKKILSSLNGSINRVLKGSFIIAIAQGILAWIGFMIFGVPNAAIWAVVSGIASFVPTLGTSIVSIPAIIYLLATGMQIQALGLLLWSMLLIGTIDNLLSPYIISKNTNIPSIFILFSILGGVSLMGPVGILIGPLVLSLLYSLVSIYKSNE
jgi:predicted PurR-regulated permease PerM